MPRVASERLRSWIVLAQITAANESRRRHLLESYGSFERAVEASLESWRASGLLRPSGANDIFRPASGDGEAKREPTKEEIDAWTRDQLQRAAGIDAAILCLEDERYPDWLRTIPEPPPVLFVMGSLEILGEASIAVVGARSATRYGLAVARNLARELARYGLVVTSGGARGIDSAAHRGALDAGGRTVVVTAAGLDRPYPPENADLFREIAASGAVVSEFPFGVPPLSHHFPVRNRVIAGLSLGVVVVEGKPGSGSLITARRAVDYGREVFAVPGQLTNELSEGPHMLIQEGAKLLMRTTDVLEELRFETPPVKRDLFGPRAAAGEEGGMEGRLLAMIGPGESRRIEELAAALELKAAELMALLTWMELRGAIEMLPGGRVGRKH